MGKKVIAIAAASAFLIILFSLFISGHTTLKTTDLYNNANEQKNQTPIIPREIIEAKFNMYEEQKSPKADMINSLTVINKMANATIPLSIKTYDGYNQSIHPDIVYISSGFNGYKYWMSYTPYPYSLDSFENPCIAASNDGINWGAPKGLKNPIVPPPDDIKSGGHYSDTDIIFDNEKLVVYYVYNKRNTNGPSSFYRVVSSDGVNWSHPELIYQTDPAISGYSPGIIKETDGYRMWYTSDGNMMFYTTSSNGSHWTKPFYCSINQKGWAVWHVDIIKTDIGYEGLLCATNYQTRRRALFYIRSHYGITWESSSLPIISPSDKGWDCFEIYRATMLKQNGLYRIWYSARNNSQIWRIGYTEGVSIDSLKGYSR